MEHLRSADDIHLKVKALEVGNQQLKEIVEKVLQENTKLKAENAKLKTLVFFNKKFKPNLNTRREVQMIVKSKTNAFGFSLDTWTVILGYLSENDIVTLSSVCQDFQRIVRYVKSSFNLSNNYRLDVNCFLTYTLSTMCTSIDINYCTWLEPSVIVEIISKTNLQHLQVLRCQIDENCMRSVCKLKLESLSMTYSKKWKFFIKENERTSLVFFRNLTKLEIEFSPTARQFLDFKTTSVVYDIFMNVLRFCCKLEHLKLLDRFLPDGRCGFYESVLTSKFQSKLTPLPKLTNLEVDINSEECTQDLINMLQLILKGKMIPLTNVDFCRSTCHLLENGILNHPLIQPNKLTYIFRACVPRCLSQLKFNRSTSQTSQTTYKKILVENVGFSDFEGFVKGVISKSRKSVEEVEIIDCYTFKTVIKGLEHLAIICPKVTVLELSIMDWLDGDFHSRSYKNYGGIAKNEALMEALKNFNNLKKLTIHPSMLQCDYYKYDNNCRIIIPFWKVTKACEQLCELYITNSDNFSSSANTIHIDSLYDIAHCKNLRVLQLYDFAVRTSMDFALSNITRTCTRLQKLDIFCVKLKLMPKEKLENLSFILEKGLSYVEDLKTLRIELSYRFLTKSLLISLYLMKNLENLSLGLSKHHKDEDIRNLTSVLPKLKNLFVFYVQLRENKDLTEKLNTVFEKIKINRPSFSGYVNKYAVFLHSYLGFH